MSARQHISEVDGIRGILSLLVFSAHVYAPPIFWAPGAMEFFFVISGYFITRILFGAPRHDVDFFKTYAIRRALRVWPMYYFALVLYIGATGWLLPHVDFRWGGEVDFGWAPAWEPVLLATLFLQNLDALFGPAAVGYPRLFAHSWSIAIEEQFYILWPVLFLLVIRAGYATRVFMAVSCVAMAVMFRCASYMELGHAGMWMLPARLDSFGLGIVLAFLVRSADGSPLSRQALVRGLKVASAVGLVLLVPYLVQGYGLTSRTLPAVLAWTLFYPTLGFAVLAFGAIGLVIMHAGTPGLAWLRVRPLVYLGNISYSTYMLHPLAIVLVTIALDRAGLFSLPAQWLLGLALSLGAAHLTHRYIETRALALKRRVPYRAAPAEGPDPECQPVAVAHARN